MNNILTSQDQMRLALGAGFHSYLMVPLLVRGVVLGGVEFVRLRNGDPFDEADVAVADQLAARTALCMDNARLRSHEWAVTASLQHMLSPRGISTIHGMDIAFRHLPSIEDRRD